MGRRRTFTRAIAALGAAAFTVGGMTGMASSQIINNQGTGVGNSGGASAGTGNNSATGNNSSNTAGTTAGTPGGGGLLGALVNLGSPTNTSTGDASVGTGGAAAAGNNSTTGVGQAQGGGGGGLVNSQGVGVSNAGNANASTGGNSAIGNNSTNNAAINQTASGGLLGLNVNLGSPTNNSSGTASIITGPATATGNVSETGVVQDHGGAIVGGSLLGHRIVDGRLVPCGALFNSQGANVDNIGTANASTGGNDAIGNNSTNVATTSSGLGNGLLDIPISIGGPTNTSGGTASVDTGAANALGNQATTGISQNQCVPAGAALNPAFATPTVFGVVRSHGHGAKGTLALTGRNPGPLMAVGGVLLLAGYGLLHGGRKGSRIYLP